jgi:hypothetical protein
MSDEPAMKALIDFDCLESDCEKTVQFDLLALKEDKGKVSCGHCARIYKFDKEFLAKLEKLRHLVVSVQAAEDILGDCNVSITTPAGEVKIPYRLLLTRLNTLISLKVGGKVVDFHFRVEPLNNGAFK